MTIRILHGDCLVLLPTLQAETIDACVTDPPYGLEFMGKDWDGSDGFRRSLNAADAARANVFGRTSQRGPEYRATPIFQRWCEAWAREIFRVLKPGAYLLAFGGTRTSHRLVCAIEDAGFEIRDTVAWLYGSGFPKSLNVARAIDKAAGVEGVTVPSGDPVKRMIPGADQNKDGWIKDNGRLYQPGEYMPASDAAAAWAGWGTALKPAFEPVVVARKPLRGTVVANVLRHGTGAINVASSVVPTDEGPVQRDDEPTAQARYTEEGATNFAAMPGARRGRPLRVARPDPLLDETRTVYGDGIAGSRAAGETTVGRFPANVIHDGSEEVLAAFPTVSSGKMLPTHTSAARKVYGQNAAGGYTTMETYGDTGSAARFFYTAKADAHDRQGSKHPTVKPTDLMRYLVRLVTPQGGTVLDPFCGTGSTLVAADQLQLNAIGIEREAQYVSDARRKFERDAGLFAEILP